ncbi:MAG: VWA domain-containing protein [Planctomycetaceae bacterium]|nr:VWA domain-containing protein [Planctomycetaceae bacterium]
MPHRRLFLALACLLLVYFHPQWEHFVGSSRVAIIVDTSASMGNRDILQRQSNEAELLPLLDAGVSSTSGTSFGVVGRVSAEIDLVKSQLESLELVKADGEETSIGDVLFEVFNLSVVVLWRGW